MMEQGARKQHRNLRRPLASGLTIRGRALVLPAQSSHPSMSPGNHLTVQCSGV
nr:uncharacterized protein CTRU02_04207 [Colletotrichum truncatum]KAF6796246.1 hypothetical protein CTRU02_04207 [Colletotrichum truncatum]